MDLIFDILTFPLQLFGDVMGCLFGLGCLMVFGVCCVLTLVIGVL